MLRWVVGALVFSLIVESSRSVTSDVGIKACMDAAKTCMALQPDWSNGHVDKQRVGVLNSCIIYH